MIRWHAYSSININSTSHEAYTFLVRLDNLRTWYEIRISLLGNAAEASLLQRQFLVTSRQPDTFVNHCSACAMYAPGMIVLMFSCFAGRCAEGDGGILPGGRVLGGGGVQPLGPAEGQEDGTRGNTYTRYLVYPYHGYVFYCYVLSSQGDG